MIFRQFDQVIYQELRCGPLAMSAKREKDWTNNFRRTALLCAFRVPGRAPSNKSHYGRLPYQVTRLPQKVYIKRSNGSGSCKANRQFAD